MNLPDGYKLVAWQGVGLPVPLTWDISRYRGDHLYGSFRVDNLYRTVVEVSWQPTKRKHDMLKVARMTDARLTPAKGDVLEHLKYLPDGARAFMSEDDEPRTVALVWQYPQQRTTAMVHVTLDKDGPNKATLAAMLQGIVTPELENDLDWAGFDFHLQSPRGYKLSESSLATGVCRLTFKRGFGQLSFRRFSALSSIVTSFDADDIEHWLRFAYADAFHDMRYKRDAMEKRADGYALRYIATRLGYGAIEWRGLFPQFRWNPTQIVVHVSQAGNSAMCFERNRRVSDALFDAMIASANRQPLPELLDVPKQLPAHVVTPRTSLLGARIGRKDDALIEESEAGEVRLSYAVRRPGRLRFMRMLAGQPFDATQKRKVELDAIGSLIWRTCAKPMRMTALIETVMQHLNITAREAELSVTQYVNAMVGRGLLTIKHKQFTAKRGG